LAQHNHGYRMIIGWHRIYPYHTSQVCLNLFRQFSRYYPCKREPLEKKPMLVERPKKNGANIQAKWIHVFSDRLRIIRLSYLFGSFLDHTPSVSFSDRLRIVHLPYRFQIVSGSYTFRIVFGSSSDNTPFVSFFGSSSDNTPFVLFRIVFGSSSDRTPFVSFSYHFRMIFVSFSYRFRIVFGSYAFRIIFVSLSDRLRFVCPSGNNLVV